jgi:hypothetical protein
MHLTKKVTTAGCLEARKINGNESGPFFIFIWEWKRPILLILLTYRRLPIRNWPTVGLVHSQINMKSLKLHALLRTHEGFEIHKLAYCGPIADPACQYGF